MEETKTRASKMKTKKTRKTNSAPLLYPLVP